ncbi:MAG: bifunctional 4-hydroxy-2-oxoglutarate aldolase/2-dehydro-3-deoxy-phosphogluconate aldolase [Acidimicrobiia bacterium]|nr:bifunctional 4-hydroxy-2-oxoglutarate aldolase/2-dehydro-3-deoxy-phosphogluconate aldolase [Acidimicrobiia bacterium]
MIRQAGVLPVVTIDDADHAVPLAEALGAGHIDVVEVTLRTDAGLAAIAAIAKGSPSTCVGAGSVTTADQAHAAADAGAQFLVSPGFDDGVVAAARDRDVPVIPGVATPTELMRALAHDLIVLKFFPAEPLGGLESLRTLSSVWPDVRFVPTGGVSAGNAADYLADPCVLAVGGSWVAPRQLVASQDWGQITTLAARARALAGSVR